MCITKMVTLAMIPSGQAILVSFLSEFLLTKD